MTPGDRSLCNRHTQSQSAVHVHTCSVNEWKHWRDSPVLMIQQGAISTSAQQQDENCRCSRSFWQSGQIWWSVRRCRTAHAAPPDCWPVHSLLHPSYFSCFILSCRGCVCALLMLLPFQPPTYTLTSSVTIHTGRRICVTLAGVNRLK